MTKFTVNNLTLKQKVGQMLCFAFHGDNYSEQLEFFIKEVEIGSVVYFSRNITSIAQSYNLNNKLQSESKIPLLIGIDQEGGIVQRITNGVTPLIGAMGLAAGNRKEIYNICNMVGDDLKTLGFNINYAPVGDVNNNPLNPVINSRSYSDNPNVVSECAIEAFKGFQDSGVLPTIKHFPGHGNTNVDSHIGLPIVESTQAEVEKVELVPFKNAIENGIDGVMMSHIIYKCYDEKYPASLSYNIVNNILKEKLGFKGLIVTDSLTMNAIYANFTVEDVLINTVNAGVDILIFCGKAKVEEQREIYHKFISLVESGKIAISKVDEAVAKIIKYKEKYCTNDQQREVKYQRLLSNKDYPLSEKLSLESITIVKDKNKILPITDQDKVLIVFPEIKLFTLVDNDDQEYTTLGKYLKKEEVIIKQDFSNLNQLMQTIDQYDKIIMVTYNVTSNDYQTRMYNMLKDKQLMIVSLRSPYDCYHLKDVQSHICIYEPTPLAMQSLSKIMKGEVKAIGKLPVKL